MDKKEWSTFEEVSVWICLLIFLFIFSFFMSEPHRNFFVNNENYTIVRGDGLNSRAHDTFYDDAIKNKIYPLWNPYNFSGMPSYVDGFLFLPQGNENLPYIVLFISMLYLTIKEKKSKKSFDNNYYVAIGVLVYTITSIGCCAAKYLFFILYGRILII